MRDGSLQNYDWVQGTELKHSFNNSSFAIKQLREQFFRMQFGSTEYQKLSDVTFVLAEDKKILANRFFLSARSSVFRIMFSIHMMEAESQELILSYPNYSYNSFFAFIYFLYTGDAIITNQNIIEVLAIATEFQVFELSDICSKLFVDLINQENVFELIEANVHLYNEQLADKLFRFIDSKFESISYNRSFLMLSLEHVQEIIMRDSLFSKEIIVLNAVRNWGMYQLTHEEIFHDVETLTKEPSNDLVRTIAPLLTYVRFPFLKQNSYHIKYKPEQLDKSAQKPRLFVHVMLFDVPETDISNSYHYDKYTRTLTSNAKCWTKIVSTTSSKITENPLIVYSVKIIKCDHHNNVKIGLIYNGNECEYYGYNGAILVNGFSVSSTRKYGKGDTVHMIFDFRQLSKGQFKLYIVLNDDVSDFTVSTINVKASDNHDIYPIVRLYCMNDQVQFIEEPSTIAMYYESLIEKNALE
jgi:hypothetical protein